MRKQEHWPGHTGWMSWLPPGVNCFNEDFSDLSLNLSLLRSTQWGGCQVTGQRQYCRDHWKQLAMFWLPQDQSHRPFSDYNPSFLWWMCLRMWSFSQNTVKEETTEKSLVWGTRSTERNNSPHCCGPTETLQLLQFKQTMVHSCTSKLTPVCFGQVVGSVSKR